METHPQDHWKVVLKERKENSMAERISESQKELVAATESHKHLVDYFIVNDHNDIEKVIKEISSIIKKHSN